MKKGILLLSAILALGSLSSSAQKRTATMTDEEMYLDAMHHNITTEKIFGYVKQLSDPALEGRLAGSPGMAKAVDIVKGYFKEWELIPGGENGSYTEQPSISAASMSSFGMVCLKNVRATIML